MAPSAVSQRASSSSIASTLTPAGHLLPLVLLRGQKPLPEGYPTELQHVGDHIRKRRMDRGLFLGEVAETFGADLVTVLNWEKGYSKPTIRFWPSIIDFLGYDPSPKPTSISEKLRALRRRRGWNQKRLAQELGVDPTTLGRWERGAGPFSRKHWALVETLLAAES